MLRQKIVDLCKSKHKFANLISGEAPYFLNVSCFFSAATVDTLFLATIAAESIAISDDAPIIFDTAPINPGDNYNPVLGAYTAPETGYYQRVLLKGTTIMNYAATSVRSYVSNYFYRLQTKLREAIVCTGVCDSVHRGGMPGRGVA